MKETIFKKVMVSDRLPDESKVVLTDLGFLTFYFGTQDFSIVNKTQLDGSDDRLPKFWLEEIELPKDEEIYEAHRHLDNNEYRDGIFDGANYILNKLK